jgi:hypothetical protein
MRLVRAFQVVTLPLGANVPATTTYATNVRPAAVLSCRRARPRTSANVRFWSKADITPGSIESSMTAVNHGAAFACKWSDPLMRRLPLLSVEIDRKACEQKSAKGIVDFWEGVSVANGWGTGSFQIIART